MDEEDDEVAFEAIIVTRSSPEGRMMSKWLLAARKKMGGLFPRPDAKRQMDRYAQKLRDLKMKKTRASSVGSQYQGVARLSLTLRVSVYTLSFYQLTYLFPFLYKRIRRP